MSEKRYIWLGPSTVVEVWSPGDPPTLIYSGAVVTGREIPALLDEDHEQVASWRAFKLIGLAPETPAAEPVAVETVAPKRKKTEESANG